MHTTIPEFHEAEAALLHALSVLVRQGHDPLADMFVLVHESSAALHREACRRGAQHCGDGFVITMGDRSGLPAEARIAPDQVAAMVSIGGRSKALGFDLETLGLGPGGEA